MKTFRILTDSAELDVVQQVVAARLASRGLTPAETAEFTLTVSIDPHLPKESFRIVGPAHNVHITADRLVNVFAGCGRFLYTSRFGTAGITPSVQRGLTTFDCSIRCVYTATHFHTFYFTAPLEEVYTYLEDFALMGVNGILYSVPDLNLDPSRPQEMSDAFDRCAAVGKKAAAMGIRLLMGGTTSVSFLEIPDELRATPIPDPIPCRGNTGHKVCPSKPEGQKLLDELNRFMMNEWKKRGVPVDYAVFFPYDEGGCGCSECHPWGARGYIKACKRAAEVIRETYPDCKFIVSTWLFDRPEEGEWAALSASLQEEKWADVIEADSHTSYPRYPLDVGVPGDLPLIAFPEISMWGLWPWGGFGASFFPKRYTDIWRSTGGKLQGGRMYSEGIFEDLNKYTVCGLYRDYNNDPDTAVAEYAAYHFGCPDPAAFVEMVDCIERNTILNADSPASKVFMTAERNHSDPQLTERAWNLAQQIDAQLPEWGRTCWRWRLMYIRACLDRHRFANKKLHEEPEALALMQELQRLYHCMDPYRIAMDPFHLKLRPPVPVTDEDFDVSRYPFIGSIHMAASIGLIINSHADPAAQTFAEGNQA